MNKVELKNSLGLPVLLMMMAHLFFSGCGGPKTLFGTSTDKNYERMLEQQKMKAVATEEPSAAVQQQSAKDDPLALERLGDTYVKQGNYDMAFVQYGKALKIDPGLIDTRQKIASLYLRKGLAGDALTEFNTILAKEPDNTRALHGKATALVQLNRLPEAEEALQKEISIDPRAWQAYALLGNIYDKQKHYETATSSYRKATEINPKSASVYTSLGVSLLSMGKYRESVDAFLSAIRLDPSHQQAYNDLGLSLFKLGKYPEALEAFKRGGDEAGAYNNMGVLFLEEKKYADAVEYFEKAIDTKPSYYESAQAGLKKAKAALLQVERSKEAVQTQK